MVRFDLTATVDDPGYGWYLDTDRAAGHWLAVLQ